MAGQFDYLVKKLVRSSQGAFKKGWNRAAFYLQFEYPSEVEYHRHSISFPKLNIQIKQNEFSFVLTAFPILRLFGDHGKVQFQIEGGKFFIHWEGLKLNPTTAEEIFIIQEIFVCGTYNFRIANPSNAVIDIGMNVAFASLFFASKDEVKKVYSFEPFQPTYQQALSNIQHNPHCASKIECFNYGIHDVAQTLELDYSYENKGQVGIHGTDLIRSQNFQSERKSIQLLPAHEELKKIFERNPQQRFILKVDCEGAEYAIFKSLAAHKLLDQVDLIFIEWHELGPEPLLDILAESNFKIFYQQSSSKKVGMIYASR